jgi:hypothetical protein
MAPLISNECAGFVESNWVNMRHRVTDIIDHRFGEAVQDVFRGGGACPRLVFRDWTLAIAPNSSRKSA